MITVFVPMQGLLQTLWLDGYYSQAVTYLKAYVKIKHPRGRVESIRLVIAGKPQRRALSSSVAEWETYMVHAFPGKALEYIDGFILRVKT